jgi:hypothetical protein
MVAGTGLPLNAWTPPVSTGGKQLRSPFTGVEMEPFFVPSVFVRRMVLEHLEKRRTSQGKSDASPAHKKTGGGDGLPLSPVKEGGRPRGSPFSSGATMMMMPKGG